MTREEAEKALPENERLIYYTVKKYFPAATIDEDLLQEGRLGLWRACLAYDPESEGCFSSLAVACIRNAVSNYLRHMSRFFRRDPSGLVHLDDTPPGGKNDYYDLVQGAPDVDWADLDGIRKCLTERQWNYLSMLLQGYSLVEIGKHFGVTKQNVDNALKAVRKKISQRGLL